METGDLIQIGLMCALVVATGIYAWRTHKISQSSDKAAKATLEQAKATTALASREYVKEFIRLEIHPLLKRCFEVKKKLQTNYFAQDYRTGWPEIYGLPTELSGEEAKVLKIGILNGREVFKFPDPSLGILQGRYYFPPDTSVWLRLRELEDEHKEVANRIADFDTKLPQLNKLLRSVAADVKKLVTSYVSNLEKKRLLEIHSKLDKGQLVSNIAEMCFNYLLLTSKDFDYFFKEFQRDQAKNFWEENRSGLQALLSKEQVNKKVSDVRQLSNRLLKELSEIFDKLETSEKHYRKQCYITYKELPPFLLS